MEHIPLTADPLFTFLSIIAPLAAIGLLILGIRAKRDSRKELALYFLALGSFFVWPIVLSYALAMPQDQQRASFAAQAERLYGIELSTEDTLKLRYPLSEPREDFKVFGNTGTDRPSEEGFERSEALYLIWKDGEFQLAGSADSETFTELKR